MKHVRLISFTDQVTGETGMGFKGHTDHPALIADLTGRLIAHDICEHQNGLDAIGCAGDELQALGGTWQVRGRHGFPDRKNMYQPPTHMIAGDIFNVAMSVDGEDQEWTPIMGRYHSRPHEIDEDFECILEEARPWILAEMRDDEHPLDIDSFIENALHLLRMGFRKSERRWGYDCGGYEQYMAIMKAVAPCVKNIEIEGQEFRLSYGLGLATCKEIHLMEEY